MSLTIQQAIDAITPSIPNAPFAETVDTVKSGDTSQPLTGITVTFLVNCKVIEQAAQLGANLIVTHLPTYCNHEDKADWLESNAVYQAKRDLLRRHNLVVWRFHDYLHSSSPDPTGEGLRSVFGWDSSTPDQPPYLYSIQSITLRELTAHVKKSLGIHTLRIAGDINMKCKLVAIAPGFPGGQFQIGRCLAQADVLITGEIHEWETSEYTRDAASTGNGKGLIVTSHAASEEPGVKFILPWLNERLPVVEIQFIPTENPFHYV